MPTIPRENGWIKQLAEFLSRNAFRMRDLLPQLQFE
jgi:hypothetical protein